MDININKGCDNIAKWSLKYVCEIDWYDLESERDREFVENPEHQPFIIHLDRCPMELASTIKWLNEEGLSEMFINIIIEAYANNCSSVVMKP